MEEEYVLDGKIYTASQLSEYAKQSNLSLEEYIYESGATVKNPNKYILDGKTYTDTQLKQYAKMSNLSLEDYLYESGAKPFVKKKDSSVSVVQKKPQAPTTELPSEDGLSATQPTRKKFSLTAEDLKTIGQKQPTDMSGKPLLPKLEDNKKLLKKLEQEKQALEVEKKKFGDVFDKQLNVKPKIEESQYLKDRLSSIDTELINKTESFVVPKLQYQFGDLGFKFEEARAGRDYVKAIAPNGKTIEISLDNWRDETSKYESEILKKFIKENTPAKGLFVLEKTMREQDKKFNSEKQVDDSIKVISDEVTALNAKQKQFLLKKSSFEKALEMYSSSTDKNTIDSLEQQRLALNEEMKSILEEEETIKQKSKRLDIAVGKYSISKSKQGSWGGAIVNAISEGFSSISAGATSLYTDISTEIAPAGFGMSPKDLKNISIDIAKKIGVKGPSENQTVEQWKSTLTEDKLDEWEDQVDDYIKKDIKSKTLPYIRIGNRELFGDEATTKEFSDLKEQGFWGGAILGVSKSLPAMIGGAGPIGWAQRTAQMYTQIADALAVEMENDPQFANITENEKLAITLPIGITSAVLEAYGLRNVMASKGVINSITMSVLGKVGTGASAKTFRELVENEVESKLARGLITITAAGVAEFETGAAQEATETGFKVLYDEIKGKDMFNTPDSKLDFIENIAVAGAQEAIGGFVLGVPSGISAAYSKKGFLKLDDLTFQTFANMANDTKLQSAYIASLKDKITQGIITEKEAKERLNNYRNSAGLYRQLPDGLTTEQQKEAMNLLKEKRDLENYVDGKDPALVVKQKNRITEINDSLTKLSETNAIQEPSTDESVLRAEQPEVELQGMGEGNAQPVEVTQEEVIATNEPEEVKGTFLENILGKIYEYEDPITGDKLRGNIFFDGKEVVFTDSNKEFSLGTVQDVLDSNNLNAKEVQPNFNINEEGTITLLQETDGIPQGEIKPQGAGLKAIKTDKDGNVKRVVITDANGVTHSIKGELANDLAEVMMFDLAKQGGLTKKINSDGTARETFNRGVREANAKRKSKNIKESVQGPDRGGRVEEVVPEAKPIELAIPEAKVEEVTPEVEAETAPIAEEKFIIDGKEYTKDEAIQKGQQNSRYPIFGSKMEYNGNDPEAIEFVKSYNQDSNPYHKKGQLKGSYMKEQILKALNEMNFRKFGNLYRKHIDPYFSRAMNEKSVGGMVGKNFTFRDLAGYKIGDSDYSTLDESSFRAFAKDAGIEIPEFSPETATTDTIAELQTETTPTEVVAPEVAPVVETAEAVPTEKIKGGYFTSKTSFQPKGSEEVRQLTYQEAFDMANSELKELESQERTLAVQREIEGKVKEINRIKEQAENTYERFKDFSKEELIETLNSLNGEVIVRENQIGFKPKGSNSYFWFEENYKGGWGKVKYTWSDAAGRRKPGVNTRKLESKIRDVRESAKAKTEVTPTEVVATERVIPKNKQQRIDAALKGDMVYHRWFDTIFESTPEQYNAALKEIAETGAIADVNKYGREISERQAPSRDSFRPSLLSYNQQDAQDTLDFDKKYKESKQQTTQPVAETKTEVAPAEVESKFSPIEIQESRVESAKSLVKEAKTKAAKKKAMTDLAREESRLAEMKAIEKIRSTKSDEIKSDIDASKERLKKAWDKYRTIGIAFDPKNQLARDRELVKSLVEYAYHNIRLRSYEAKNLIEDLANEGFNITRDGAKFIMDKASKKVQREINKTVGVKKKPTEQKRINKAYAVGVATQKVATEEAKAEVKDLKGQVVDVFRAGIDAVKMAKATAQEKARRIKEISNQLVKDIKELESTGKITPTQALNMISKFNKVNMLNDVSVSNFVDYMGKVFADADYDNKINVAKGKLKNARKNIISKIGISNGLAGPLQKLFSINPTLIPETYFKRYLELVDMFGARQAVLTLEEKTKVTNDVIEILDEINNERSAVDELAERFNYSDNKVIEDGKLNYAATVKNMLKEGEIDEKEAELMTKYKKDIMPQVEKSTMSEDELQQEKDELLQEIRNSTINANDLPTRTERDAARKLNSLLKNPAIKQLSNVQLKNLLKVIDNINNGYFPHFAHLITEEINSINNSKVLEESVNRAKPLPLSALYAKAKSILTRKDAILEMIRRNPLFNIDQVFGDFKTKDIFNSILEKAAEASAKFTFELKSIQSKLSDAENKVAKSFKLDANKTLMSKFKMMTYMVQLEYQSNPDSKQVNPASKFIEATIDHINQGKSQFGERDAEMLQEILDNYTDADGNIDIDKLYNSFNSAEKSAIKTVQDINESLKEKAEYTAAVIRGQKISPLSNYIHLNVLSDIGPNDLASGESFADQYNNSLRPSTRAKSLIERTGKVSPLNFDVFASAQRGAKFVLMDYHLTEPIRTARKTINKTIVALGKMDKDKRRIINAISNSFEESVENLVKNSYIETSFGDDVANYISKQGYRSVLAGTGRFAAEFLSNVGFVIFDDPMIFSKGLGYTSTFLSSDAPLIMHNVNSKEINRIFPSETLSGRMIDTNILNEANGIKGGKAKGKIKNKAEQIWNLTGKKYKNAVELTADVLITTPDKAVMRPIWFGAFATNFKNETGKDIDFEKIAANDETYMSTYKDAIENSKDFADNKSVVTGASNNEFTGILKGTVKPNQSISIRAFNNFNNFMTRFLIYEYTSARTGIMAAVGNGSMSKKQGVALLAGVTTRMTVYSLLSKALGSGLIGLLFGDDDDEEEEKKSLEKSVGQALTSTFTSLLFNRDFGNASKAVINEGIERINENYLQALREGDYDPYKDAIQYTPVPIEKKGKQTGLLDYIENMSGSYGPAIKTTNLIIKTYSEDDKKEAEAIQRQKDVKNIRIPLEVLGNTGFIPLYKEIRKEVMKNIYKGLDKKTSKPLTKEEYYKLFR